MTTIEGLPRAYFYKRLADALDEVLWQKQQLHLAGLDDTEEREPEMVAKVNIQQAVLNLAVCPVCRENLGWSADYPLEKSCDCGDFTITEVWLNGDVTFEFKMVAQAMTEAVDNEPDEDARRPIE